MLMAMANVDDGPGKCGQVLRPDGLGSHIPILPGWEGQDSRSSVDEDKEGGPTIGGLLPRVPWGTEALPSPGPAMVGGQIKI